VNNLAETAAVADQIGENLAQIRERIAVASTKAGRHPDEITIFAVSKTVDRATIDAAYRAGLRAFGENRVQDAIAKLDPPLPADASMHLIGQLQSNKAKLAVQHFDLIESVDRPSLVAALASAAQARKLTVPVLVQVNIAGETQKAGCTPADAPALIESILAAPNLSLAGLMAIAPLVEDSEAVRPVFSGLRELRDRLRVSYPELNLSVLSMGMSNDFEIAVEEGASHVRIGRALFS
jgi:pyridoxal phosphate enzyme (YggS family)